MTKSKKNKRRRLKTKKNTKLRRGGGLCKTFKSFLGFKTDSHNTITKKEPDPEPKPVSRFVIRSQQHTFMTKLDDFTNKYYQKSSKRKREFVIRTLRRLKKKHHNEVSTSSSD